MEDIDIFGQASKEWNLGNVTKAFKLFYQAAKQGDASAQNNLGYFYDEIEGVENNKQKALYWYKKAVKNGEICACMNIAKIYKKNGNQHRAKFWLFKAVEHGDGDAALELAKLYLEKKRKDNLIKANKYLKHVINSQNVSKASIEEAQLLLS